LKKTRLHIDRKRDVRCLVSLVKIIDQRLRVRGLEINHAREDFLRSDKTALPHDQLNDDPPAASLPCPEPWPDWPNHSEGHWCGDN
jgi:hypothetical protein